jgi:hypothetical protein
VTSGPQGQSERGPWGHFPAFSSTDPRKRQAASLFSGGPIKRPCQAVADDACRVIWGNIQHQMTLVA